MNIDLQRGLITEVQYHRSPNQDDRPDRDDISGIVIHNISLPPGDFNGGWIDDLFLNKLDPKAHPYFEKIADQRVSTHLLINRDGSVIQYVPFHQRAWHAGVSSWNGRQRCNDFTIGIELEGCDDQIFEAIQYEILANTIRLLVKTYPQLSLDKITGHSDIAPERKTDPGPCFDWPYLRQLLC